MFIIIMLAGNVSSKKTMFQEMKLTKALIPERNLSHLTPTSKDDYRRVSFFWAGVKLYLVGYILCIIDCHIC
jgi:hypothetical protein